MPEWISNEFPVDAGGADTHTERVALMIELCVLVALGLVAVWRWGHLDVVAPWAGDETWPLLTGEGFRRYLWYATVGFVASLVSGVVMLGAGGRLAMRLLAITAGDAAQGRVTEAEQVVGEITLEGTIGFIAFFGLMGGFFFGMVYMLVRHWLPKGRWGGFVYGSLLLILFATRLDPLRPENKDFDIVGPGWLSVLVYVALGWAYGMLVAAIAGRVSRWLPEITKERKVLAHYAPLLILGLLWFFLVPLAIGAVVTLLVTRVEGLDEVMAGRPLITVGRAIGSAAAAVAAPGFVAGVVDIATR